MKNFGYNHDKEIADRKETDYLFGASSPKCIAEIPREQRRICLPQGEIQHLGDEKRDCSPRADLNDLESKFNYLFRNDLLPIELQHWLLDNGYAGKMGIEFSDRLIAILSGTDPLSGNSLIAPLQAIHEHGLIPKKMFPQVEDSIEYYDPNTLTDEMTDLGKEFLKRFKINYERVYEKSFDEWLERDVLIVAGYAWEEEVNGEIPRSENDPNHAFLAFDKPKTYIFDNYKNSQGDFIKKLAADYDFLGYGYRLIISLPARKDKTLRKDKTFIEKLREWIEEFGHYYINRYEI